MLSSIAQIRGRLSSTSHNQSITQESAQGARPDPSYTSGHSFWTSLLCFIVPPHPSLYETRGERGKQVQYDPRLIGVPLSKLKACPGRSRLGTRVACCGSSHGLQASASHKLTYDRRKVNQMRVVPTRRRTTIRSRRPTVMASTVAATTSWGRILRSKFVLYGGP
jgi:hypothetical protein